MLCIIIIVLSVIIITFVIIIHTMNTEETSVALPNIRKGISRPQLGHF